MGTGSDTRDRLWLVTPPWSSRRVDAVVAALGVASHGRACATGAGEPMFRRPHAPSTAPGWSTASLMVIEAHGGGPGSGSLFDDDAEQVLATSGDPVLVIGPNVTTAAPWPTTLVVLVDGSAALGTLAPVVLRLRDTMEDLVVEVTELGAPQPWPTALAPDVPSPSAAFAASVGASIQRRVTDRDPHVAVLEAAGDDRAALVVVAARRWSDPGEHWYGDARRMIRSAPVPVLVVPDDLVVATETGQR